jgi:hypothetical protein
MTTPLVHGERVPNGLLFAQAHADLSNARSDDGQKAALYRFRDRSRGVRRLGRPRPSQMPPLARPGTRLASVVECRAGSGRISLVRPGDNAGVFLIAWYW